MLFGSGSDAAKAAVDAAKLHIRDTSNFNWTFIFILVVVLVIYMHEYKSGNYRAIYAALALYTVHWFYEIINACICAGTGYPLWTVSFESTSYILMIGVSWELNMMFALAGFSCNLLPADPKKKILKIPNRILFAVLTAAAAGAIEIFLAGTSAFIWVYKWWGAIPVWITVYIPFFLAAYLIYDAKPKVQRIFVGSLAAVDIVLFACLAPLGII